VELNGDSGTITVEVEAEGEKNVYTVTLKKVSAVDVTLTMNAGVTAEVLNENGSKIEPKTAGGNVYALVPGAKYHYVGTKEKNYHTTAEFEATDQQTVAVAEPEVKQVLTAFAMYDKMNSKTRKAYEWEEKFTSGTYDYRVQVPDTDSNLYVQATKSDKDYSYYTRFMQQINNVLYADVLQDWKAQSIQYNVDASQSASSIQKVITSSGQSNVLSLQVRKTAKGVTYYQEYSFELVRTLHLSKLEASKKSGDVLSFVNTKGESLTFDREVMNYMVKVSGDTQEIQLAMQFPNEKSTYSFDGGYYAEINGKRYETVKNITVPLDVNQEQEVITIGVHHKDAKSISNTYKLTVKNAEAYKGYF